MPKGYQFWQPIFWLPNLVLYQTAQHQAIIWINAALLSIEPLGINFSDFFYQNTMIFIHNSEFENVICYMAAILSGPQHTKG